MSRFHSIPGRRLLAPLVAGALALTALAGCGGGGVGGVSGEVKLRNGEALPYGDIAFLSQVGEKKVVNGKVQDGRYSVNDVPAGPVKITVQTSPPPKPAHLPAHIKPIEGPDGDGSQSTPAGKYRPIPQKYASPDSSGLTYEVKRGDQTHDITLTP